MTPSATKSITRKSLSKPLIRSIVFLHLTETFKQNALLGQEKQNNDISSDKITNDGVKWYKKQNPPRLQITKSVCSNGRLLNRCLLHAAEAANEGVGAKG